MKEKIYKLFLVLVVSLSLGSNPLFQNEMRKLLEALSGVDNTQVIQELDERRKQKEVRRNKKVKA